LPAPCFCFLNYATNNPKCVFGCRHEASVMMMFFYCTCDTSTRFSMCVWLWSGLLFTKCWAVNWLMKHRVTQREEDRTEASHDCSVFQEQITMTLLGDVWEYTSLLLRKVCLKSLRFYVTPLISSQLHLFFLSTHWRKGQPYSSLPSGALTPSISLK